MIFREKNCKTGSQSSVCTTENQISVKFRFFEKDTKIWKNLPLVYKAWNFEFTAISLYLQMLALKLQFKVEKISKGSLDSIPSVKIQIMGGKFAWGVKAKHCWLLSTNFKVCWQHPAMFCRKNKNKKFKCSRLLEGDGIESRLPFEIFSTS